MNKIKNVLFLFFVLICFGETIQTYFPFIHTLKLEGAIYVIPKPSFTTSNWLSGKYQDSAVTYFEQQAELHPSFVRLRNQIGYSLFDEVRVSKVVLGKDQNLFGGGYIEAYLGMDFKGDDTIASQVMKLKYVQDELKKRYVDLMFVICPGKPAIQPEYIPSQYDLSKKSRSNYDAYSEQFVKQGINHIDFRSCFLKIKSTVKHPLNTRCGVHWSGYGSTVAADTLIKYIEKLRNIDLPDFTINGGEETTIPRNTDADIGEAMDLIHDIPSYPMYYPNIIFRNDTTKTKPNVLVIGDSYVRSWISFYNLLPHEFGNNSAFWYYNREVEWKQTPDNLPAAVENLNLKQQTFNRDIILLASNEINLSRCGFGFIEQMYKLLKEENKPKNQ